MNLLLVEDDESLNHAIGRKLEKEGYTIYAAFTEKEAMALCRSQRPDMVICDVGLPDGNGVNLCREIRKSSDVVFLFLTALDTENDILRGYDAGADDYMTKPFSLDVLVSKVNVLTKRIRPEDGESLISDGIVYLLSENRVMKNGAYLSLTAREQKLLLYFMENPRKVLSKNQLLESLWDIDGDFVDDNTLAVNIRRLREKIEEDPSHPEMIKNIRGLGYIWNKECVKK